MSELTISTIVNKCLLARESTESMHVVVESSELESEYESISSDDMVNNGINLCSVGAADVNHVDSNKLEVKDVDLSTCQHNGTVLHSDDTLLSDFNKDCVRTDCVGTSSSATDSLSECHDAGTDTHGVSENSVVSDTVNCDIIDTESASCQLISTDTISDTSVSSDTAVDTTTANCQSFNTDTVDIDSVSESSVNTDSSCVDIVSDVDDGIDVNLVCEDDCDVECDSNKSVPLAGSSSSRSRSNKSSQNVDNCQHVSTSTMSVDDNSSTNEVLTTTAAHTVGMTQPAAQPLTDPVIHPAPPAHITSLPKTLMLEVDNDCDSDVPLSTIACRIQNTATTATSNNNNNNNSSDSDLPLSHVVRPTSERLKRRLSSKSIGLDVDVPMTTTRSRRSSTQAANNVVSPRSLKPSRASLTNNVSISSKSCSVSNNSNVSRKTVNRPVASLLQDIGLKLTSQRVFRDLVRTQKQKIALDLKKHSRGQTSSAVTVTTTNVSSEVTVAADRAAINSGVELEQLTRLEASHSNLVAKNAAFKLQKQRCVCGFVTDSLHSLRHHVVQIDWVHMSCCMCQGLYKYKHARTFRNHLASVHQYTLKADILPPIKYQCGACPQEFTSFYNRDRHQAVCLRLFSLERNLAPSAADMDIPLTVSNRYNDTSSGVPVPTVIQPPGSTAITVLPLSASTQFVAARPVVKVTNSTQLFKIGDQLFTMMTPSTPVSASSATVLQMLPPRILSVLPTATSVPERRPPVQSSALLTHLLTNEPAKTHQVSSTPALSLAAGSTVYQACPVCNCFIAAGPHSLTCHMFVVHSAVGLPCDVCHGSVFSDIEAFSRHVLECHGSVIPLPSSVQDHQEEDTIRCLMCVFDASIPVSQLLAHLAEKHSISLHNMLCQLKCCLCSNLPRFRAVVDFEQHMISTHAAVFNNLAGLWSTVDKFIVPEWTARYSPDGTLECAYCSSNFISRGFLCRHHYMVHSELLLGATKCPHCRQVVRLGAQLVQHLAHIHTRPCTVRLDRESLRATTPVTTVPEVCATTPETATTVATVPETTVSTLPETTSAVTIPETTTTVATVPETIVSTLPETTSAITVPETTTTVVIVPETVAAVPDITDTSGQQTEQTNKQTSGDVRQSTMDADSEDNRRQSTMESTMESTMDADSEGNRRVEQQADLMSSVDTAAAAAAAADCINVPAESVSNSSLSTDVDIMSTSCDEKLASYLTAHTLPSPASTQNASLPTVSSQPDTSLPVSSQSVSLPTISSQSVTPQPISSQSVSLPTVSSHSDTSTTISSQSVSLPTVSSQSAPMHDLFGVCISRKRKLQPSIRPRAFLRVQPSPPPVTTPPVTVVATPPVTLVSNMPVQLDSALLTAPATPATTTTTATVAVLGPRLDRKSVATVTSQQSMKCQDVDTESVVIISDSEDDEDTDSVRRPKKRRRQTDKASSDRNKRKTAGRQTGSTVATFTQAGKQAKPSSVGEVKRGRPRKQTNIVSGAVNQPRRRSTVDDVTEFIESLVDEQTLPMHNIIEIIPTTLRPDEQRNLLTVAPSGEQQCISDEESEIIESIVPSFRHIQHRTTTTTTTTITIKAAQHQQEEVVISIDDDDDDDDVLISSEVQRRSAALVQKSSSNGTNGVSRTSHSRALLSAAVPQSYSDTGVQRRVSHDAGFTHCSNVSHVPHWQPATSTSLHPQCSVSNNRLQKLPDDASSGWQRGYLPRHSAPKPSSVISYKNPISNGVNGRTKQNSITITATTATPVVIDSEWAAHYSQVDADNRRQVDRQQQAAAPDATDDERTDSDAGMKQLMEDRSIEMESVEEVLEIDGETVLIVHDNSSSDEGD